MKTCNYESWGLRLALSVAMSLMLVFTSVLSPDDITVNAEPGSATAYVNSDVGAYMRKSFSTSSSKVTALDNNTRVTIIRETFASRKSYDTKKRWFYVTANGYSGYMRADTLKNFSYASQTGTVKSRVNYRSGAGTGMAQRGSLRAGQQVTVCLKTTPYGSNDTWYKVRIGSRYYYLRGKWIAFNGSSSQSETNGNASSSASSSSSASQSIPTFSLSGVNYPSKLRVNKSYSIYGKITSDYNITSAKIGVTDTSGRWILSTTKTVNGKTFDIRKADADIKFGSLGVGQYIYRADITVGGKVYTKISSSFEVYNPSSASAGTVTPQTTGTAKLITDKAFEISWPQGTSSSKYKYSGGRSTEAFKKALEKAYPNRSRWGAAPKVGASCDVFVGTVVRATGYDTKFPRGLDDQWEHLRKSKKWTEVSANKSNLKSGDIITYKEKSGAHICIYVEKNGEGYISEAAYKRYYGYINKSVSARISTKGKTWIKVYRCIK